MDEKTFNFYQANAEAVCSRYNGTTSPIFDWVVSWIRPGSRILDLGSGSGRDVQTFFRSGYDAFGVEPVEALRRESTRSFPELVDRIGDAQLPELRVPYPGTFDAILCTAVLMHLEDSEIFDAFLSIKKVLSPNGYLFLSVCQHREGLDQDGRDGGGRLFRNHSPNYLKLLLERLGFRECQRTTAADGLNRATLTWLNLTFQLRSASNSRPIDQLEGVLNNDKKDSTYKLALIRALADIATQNHHRVRWDLGADVGVPMDLIIDRWIAYYWPLIESDRFVPQRQSEEPNKKGQIKFRDSLLSLVNAFRLRGGYVQYLKDLSLESPSTDIIRLSKLTRGKIREAIVEGPIEYAGGSLGNKIFCFDRSSDLVVLSHDLWVELSLLSHWVSESVILRWAEECSRMGAKQGVQTSDVISLLIKPFDMVRTTLHMRELFQRLTQKRCVWTDKPLGREFDVDHVIPFSLWRNNDSWNLLPADSKANNLKRDKLPSQELLVKRKDAIISYWEFVYDQSERRFAKEAETLVSSRFAENWQHRLFGKLREAVELTAISRNVSRWEP